MRTRLLALGLATTLTGALLPAQSVEAITDRVFAAYTPLTPGCAVGVARNGATLLTKGYGSADLSIGRNITAETVLESGSVAKQFTATAMLLLAKDGKLTLDDDVRRYIPELPIYSRTITIRNLLTHTSGLREWSNLVEWQGWPRGTRLHTQNDILEVATHQKALNYPVGDFYSYTNTGFLLARTIIERVSKQDFERFTVERIFKPLGMTNTRWRGDYTRIVPGLAQAYSKQADGWHLDMPFDNVIGAGGLLTTVSDWLRWNQALTDKTLGTAIVDSMTRRGTLTSGREIQYALGLVVSQYRGTKEIGHSGSTAGYSTYLARYPDLDHLSIAVMCNASGAPGTALTHQIVDAMVSTLAKAAPLDTAGVAPRDLSTFAGIYRDTRTNTTRRLDVRDGALLAGAVVLRPLRDGSVGGGNVRMQLLTRADGSPEGFLQPTADGDSIRYAYVQKEVWLPTAAELAGFAGSYRSDEIGATFTVTVDGPRLMISPRAGVREAASPIVKDGFTGLGGNVWFVRDARGRVTAMHLGSGRVWDFVAARIP